MFRTIASRFTAETTVQLHPVDLTWLLETIWNIRVHPTNPKAPGAPKLGHPDHRSNIGGLDLPLIPVAQQPNLTDILKPHARSDTDVLVSADSNRFAIRWDHLIYAYMIENTRIYEIFRRVVHEFLHGEKLGVPRAETHLWLRNTEELFYREPSPFLISTLSSHIRPDLRATRRNAYQRMFGMDLNHGADDGSPYPYSRAEAANKEFVTTFEELLREVWVGHINRSNNSGAKPTDDSKIAELARQLHDMLITRRQYGNLSREEFFCVAMMSWFHLAVENDLPIIQDLRADGTSPEQRLFKIAQLVGVPAHGLSRSYFAIADDISAVLITIETGVLNDSNAARAFYDDIVANDLARAMKNIITHWSVITGHDIKAGKVAVR